MIVRESSRILRFFAVLILTLWGSGIPTTGKAMPSLADIENTGKTAGICAIVGGENGEFAASLANGRRIVHYLVTSESSRETVRSELRDRDVYGSAFAETWTEPPILPYADNLVNIIVVDADALGSSAPSDEEIGRVLAPFGYSFTKRGGSWDMRHKGLPEEMDEWKHYDRGADANAYSRDRLIGPSKAIRWRGSYQHSTDRHSEATAVRLDGGRAYYAVKNVNLPHQVGRREDHKSFIIARDAFNGVLLWKREITDAKVVPYRYGFVADGDYLYTQVMENAPLHRIRGADGQTEIVYHEGFTFPDGVGSRGDFDEEFHMIRVYEDKVLQAYRDSVCVLDAATGTRLWEYGASTGWVTQVIGGGGMVFILESPKATPWGRGHFAGELGEVVAFNAESGAEKWRYTDMDGKGYALTRLTYTNGVVPLALSYSQEEGFSAGMDGSHIQEASRLVVLNSDDGSLQYDKNVNGGGDHYPVTIADDENLYIGNGNFTVFRTADGSEVYNGERFSLAHMSANCSELRICPWGAQHGGGFLKPTDGSHHATRISRAGCDEGDVLGYGLVYSGFNTCGCKNYLNGLVVLSSEDYRPPTPDNLRLQSGVSAPQVNETQWPKSNEWPMYLGGPERASYTEGQVSDVLNLNWQFLNEDRPSGIVAEDVLADEYMPGLVTAPTVSDSTVVVGLPYQHEVRAFDAFSGETKWSFTVGGGLETPPTLYAGMCIFGAHDGYIYAVRLSDGKLVWRFMAAPSPKKMVHAGSLESSWPAIGSVMIHKGYVYCTAGRHSNTDQGIFLYKLSAETGALQYKRSFHQDPLLNKKMDNRESRYADLLVSDGENLHHWVDDVKENYAEGEDAEIAACGAAGDQHHAPDPRRHREKENLWPNWIFAQHDNLFCRRTEGYQRRHELLMKYGTLEGERIAFTGSELFTAGPTKRDYGKVHCYRRNGDGSSGDKLWDDFGKKDYMVGSSKNLYFASLAVANDKLVAGVYTRGGVNSGVIICSRSDGSFHHEIGEVGGQIVQNGIAPAYNRLYIATRNGQVLCYGPGDPIQPVSAKNPYGRERKPVSEAGVFLRAARVGIGEGLRKSDTKALGKAVSIPTNLKAAGDRQYHVLDLSGTSIAHIPIPPNRNAMLHECWYGSDMKETFAEGGVPTRLSDQFAASTSLSPNLENAGAHLGAIRGYLTVSQSVSKVFHLKAAGVDADLWIGKDNDPATASIVAWNKKPVSEPMNLRPGTKYFFQLRYFTEGKANLGVSVQWSSPGEHAAAIDSSHFSPWRLGDGYVVRKMWAGLSNDEIETFVASSRPPHAPTMVERVECVGSKTMGSRNCVETYSGYIHPPVTGTYYLRTEGTKKGSLHLITEKSEEGPSIMSAPAGKDTEGIYLVGGCRYRFEMIAAQNGNYLPPRLEWAHGNTQFKAIERRFLSPVTTK